LGVLIDSSVLVAHDRGKLNVRAWVRDADAVAISVITLIELYHGFFRAITPENQTRRQEFIDFCKRDFLIVPLDESLAEIAGRIRANLQAQGLSIGAHDLLIGVTALARGFNLATANLREFKRIPGLNVLHWQGDPPVS
jgi:tRNA(fMet)-specific endonuclease VapC